jgi:hypothetical protein
LPPRDCDGVMVDETPSGPVKKGDGARIGSTVTMQAEPKEGLGSPRQSRRGGDGAADCDGRTDFRSKGRKTSTDRRYFVMHQHSLRNCLNSGLCSRRAVRERSNAQWRGFEFRQAARQLHDRAGARGRRMVHLKKAEFPAQSIVTVYNAVD